MSALRVGIVGTSWWADAMYLPALAEHPDASVTAICGRDAATLAAMADTWSIPERYTDWRELLAADSIDALIVATPNDTHHPIAMAAFERGLPVLCEKPLALDITQAQEMVTAADAAGVSTMVPFTYRWMPTNRWTKRLVDDGFVGRPYHLHLRYFAGYARGGEYAWRFDPALAGSGLIGDLGAHWLDMARWLLGEVTAVSCTTDRFVPRGPRPDGSAYEAAEDSAVIQARFESGALAVIHVTAVAWEGTDFGQVHTLDLHGSGGTLHAVNDWSATQEVRGVRAGEPGPAQVLPIPDDIWQGAPQARVHDTYRHVFRRTESMTRAWVTSLATGAPLPDAAADIHCGARIQQLCAAALTSAAESSRWVDCSA